MIFKKKTPARKITMDQFDTGRFVYSVNHPPLCIVNSEPINTSFLNQSITGYLQHSYKFGVKDPENILPCGLSVGEAAKLYLCDIYDRRTKPSQEDKVYFHTIIQDIIDITNRHMPHLDLEANVEYRQVFDSYFNSDIFVRRHYKNQGFTKIFKDFLKEINQTTRGYTHKLKIIVKEVENLIERDGRFS